MSITFFLFSSMICYVVFKSNYELFILRVNVYKLTYVCSLNCALSHRIFQWQLATEKKSRLHAICISDASRNVRSATLTYHKKHSRE